MTKSHGNHELRKAAAEEGLIVYSGDPTAVGSPDPPPELEDVETALLMTDDDGFNGMLSADLGQYYGHDRVYQLAASGDSGSDFYVRSRILFDESATHDVLAARLDQGAKSNASKRNRGRDGNGLNGVQAAKAVRAPPHTVPFGLRNQVPRADVVQPNAHGGRDAGSDT
jgi:hypothetical protein